MAKHYVNNKTLYENMVKYIEQLNYSKSQNKPKPRVPEYVGECIYLICTRLSYKPNFINYTYKEEMVGDALENCIMAVDNFKPDKSDNPFAYFTQIAFNAFLRRIAKEKKQTYIKHKNFENLFSLDEIDAVFNDRHHVVQVTNEYSQDIISSFEEKNTLAKEKKKTPRGLDKLME
jgi:DNA-directed RNA polymerase specialized sigma24 family protein